RPRRVGNPSRLGRRHLPDLPHGPGRGRRDRRHEHDHNDDTDWSMTMQKIPTLFVRDEQDRRYVTEVVTPGCEWVMADEGQATRKFDGTCVMLDQHGDWWARREVKP